MREPSFLTTTSQLSWKMDPLLVSVCLWSSHCKSCCVMLPRSSCLLLSFICCILLSPQVLLFVAFFLSPLVFCSLLTLWFCYSFPMLFLLSPKTLLLSPLIVCCLFSNFCHLLHSSYSSPIVSCSPSKVLLFVALSLSPVVCCLLLKSCCICSPHKFCQHFDCHNTSNSYVMWKYVYF